MSLYRKKTLTEASQWFSQGHCPHWAQEAVREFPTHFEIDTREGTLKGVAGDWIACGPEGEVYPIGASIFAKTYEPADDLVIAARRSERRRRYASETPLVRKGEQA